MTPEIQPKTPDVQQKLEQKNEALPSKEEQSAQLATEVSATVEGDKDEKTTLDTSSAVRDVLKYADSSTVSGRDIMHARNA
ncbi:MAG: hypothetical protein V2A63_00065 [Patescibacteria group bacterium]